MATETAKQKADRLAAEEAAAAAPAPTEPTQVEKTDETPDEPTQVEKTDEPTTTDEDATEAVSEDVEPVVDLTPAEARTVAGAALADAQAAYYAGTGTKADVEAARVAWKAARRG